MGQKFVAESDKWNILDFKKVAIEESEDLWETTTGNVEQPHPVKEPEVRWSARKKLPVTRYGNININTF